MGPYGLHKIVYFDGKILRELNTNSVLQIQKNPDDSITEKYKDTLVRQYNNDTFY